MKKIMVAAVVVVVLACVFALVAQQKLTAAASPEPASTAAPTEVKAPVEPQTVAALTPPAPSDANAAAAESIVQAAIKKAADEKKYLFLFVSNSDTEETATAKRAVEAAATKIADKSDLAFIQRDSAAEKEAIEKFQLNRAPMPIVLALAPNGAITGAYFGDKLKDPQLQDSIASTCEQQCMKALQERKLVLLCCQNSTTKSNDVAMQGVNDFKADTRFAQFTEIVTIDPASTAEQGFLGKLTIDPQITEATTAFLAPPGVLISKVNGATTKDALVSTLTAATSGGCGAGGCGPKGCGPVK